MALENVMESIVREKLDTMIKYSDCCKCARCYEDILALALNSLPPKYINSHKGELLVRIDETINQNSIDINIALTKAMDLVGKNPRH